MNNWKEKINGTIDEFIKNANDITVEKNTTKISWFLFDKWFRILECSLIIGLLYYISHKTHDIFVWIVYYFSIAVLYLWISELGDYIFKSFVHNKKMTISKRMIVRALSFLPLVLILSVIMTAADKISALK